MAAGRKEYKINFDMTAGMDATFHTVFNKVERDFEKLERQIRQIEGARISGSVLQNLQREVEKLERDMKQINRIPGPNDYFTKLQHQIRTVLPELREIKKAMEAISRIRQPNNRFNDGIERYLRQIRELEERMRRMQQNNGPGGGGGGGGGDSEGGGGGLVALGNPAMMAGVAVGAGAVAIVSASDQYQKAMNQIQAATGMAGKDLEEMKTISKDLYSQSLGEGWEDVAQSISTVKQVTGLSGQALQQATKDAIAYRDTFGEDVTQSIRAADQMTKQFGISQHKAFNLMAQGTQQGLNTSGELIDSISEYSVYFKNLGYSASDMFDMFGAGAKDGVFQLDKVGDAIKELNIRTKDQSKSTYEGYEALGLNATQFEQAIARGGDNAKIATQKIFQSLAKIEDPVKRNAAGVALFGTQFEDLEYSAVKAMGEARKQFDSTKNTMDEVAKIKYSSMGDAFKGIGRQISTSVIIPITELALPALSSFSTWFGDVMPKVRAFFKGFDLKKVFGGGGGGFDDMRKSVQGFIKSSAPYLEKGKKMFEEISAVIGYDVQLAIPIIKSLAKIAIKLGKDVVSALTPIVTYIASKVGPIISQVFTFIGTVVIPKLLAGWSSMVPHIQNVVSMIGPLITSIWTFIKPTIDNLVALFNYAWPIIKGVVVTAIDTIVNVAKGLWDTLGGIITFLTGTFSGNWSQAWSGIVQTFSGIWGTLKGLVATPINAVIRLINKAIDRINSISLDIPDFLGGGTFGVNVAHIPEIDGYAKGGKITSPELAMIGEGGDDEYVIPMNNKPRSRALLASANKEMGFDSSGGGSSAPTQYVYSPNISINGNASADDVAGVIRDGYTDFVRFMNQYERDKRRVRLAQS